MNTMVEELAAKLFCERPTYYPEIKPDLLVGVNKGGKLELCLLEVKESNNIGLMDYSQLIGYLSVCRSVKAGLLILVPKKPSNPMFSSDFSKLMETGQVSMCWRENSCGSVENNFHKVGLLKYIPSNGFIWENTEKFNGISTLKDMVSTLLG